MDTFVLRFWSAVFSHLGSVSLFSFVRCIFPRVRRSYLFVDIWVAANLFLSIAAAIQVKLWPTSVVSCVVLIYGMSRVFETTVYQINVLLFDEYRAWKNKQKYKLKGPRRLVLLMMHNYVEIIIWYAAIYLYWPNLLKWEEWAQPDLSYALYGSFFTMSTFGTSAFAPKTICGIVLVLSQSVIGLFMTILMIARFIGIFPKPDSHDRMG